MFQWWSRSTTKDFHFLHPRKIVGLSFLVYYQFRSVWILTLWLTSDHSPKMMISREQILLRWPCRDAIWTVKVKVKVGITLYDMLSYKTKQILSILINESTSMFHADKIDRTYIHGVGQERLPSGLTMDPHFNRNFVDPVVFPSQLWLIRRYLKIHCAHPMTHIAGDHRSSGEDFPYLSSHNGSVEREWNLLLVKETFLAWRHSIFHWTNIGGSIIFFNVEHHRHPNVQLVFLGWKPPQIPEAIYKHPEVWRGVLPKLMDLIHWYRFLSFDRPKKASEVENDVLLQEAQDLMADAWGASRSNGFVSMLRKLHFEILMYYMTSILILSMSIAMFRNQMLG